jgi:acetolactate synthase-1/2/3 large subunit
MRVRILGSGLPTRPWSEKDPTMTMPPTIALQLIDVLRDFGVNRVFGIPGGAIAGVYAALMDRPDVQIINNRHETGATFMAAGYAMATGRPGVVFTTAGPGITNALTGLASAFYEGVPVVVIAGEVARSSFGRGAIQEGSSSGLDSVALVRRLTKFSAQINRPGSAAAVLRKALTTAFSGRKGPVFLSLPLDVATQPAVPQRIFGTVHSSFEVDSSACRRALEYLENADRPLILAGAGARDATSRRALRRLAEYIGSPVAVTTKGKGVFPEDHPLYLGVYGFGGHDSVTRHLSDDVDVLLACGTSLNDLATNAWSPLLKGTRAFIQVDIDAAEIGKNFSIDIGLLGPIDAVLARMLEHRRQRTHPHAVSWPGPTYQTVERSPRGALTTVEVVQLLNEVCPSDSVFATDIGEHMSVMVHFLRVREGGDFLFNLGFGSMGSGICTGIGYQAGAPERRTFVVCGDGGFMMYGSELATAVQYGINVTFVIINDARMNMVHHGIRDIFGRSPDFSSQMVDFAGLARSIGAVGRLINTRAELTEALISRADGPLVLDVHVDPEIRMLGSQRVAALKQFREGARV